MHLRKSFSIIFLFVMLISIVPLNHAEATDAVGQSSSTSSTTSISQRKIFANATTYPFTYLAFFSNGTDATYAYSTDNGTTWINGSSTALITGIVYGYKFDVKIYYNDSTQYVYLAWSNNTAGSEYWYFRRDTLSSDGHSLARGTEYEVFHLSVVRAGYPLIEVASNSRVFVGFGYGLSTTVSAYRVYSNPNNDGSGSWSGTTWSLGYTTVNAYGTLTALTNGKAYTTWTNLNVIYVRGSLWNGSAWSPFGNSTNYETIMSNAVGASTSECSLNAYDDNVYFSYINTTALRMRFMYRNSTLNAWQQEENVETTSAFAVPATLTVNSTSGDCYLFYPNTIYTNRIYYKTRYVNATYGTQSYITDSISGIGYFSVVTLPAIIGSSRIGVIWTSGTSPYYVRFNEFDFTPTVSATTYTFSGLATTTFTIDKSKTMSFSKQSITSLTYIVESLRFLAFQKLGTTTITFTENSEKTMLFLKTEMATLTFLINKLKEVTFSGYAYIPLAFIIEATSKYERLINVVGTSLLQFAVNMEKALSSLFYGTSILTFTMESQSRIVSNILHFFGLVDLTFQVESAFSSLTLENNAMAFVGLFIVALIVGFGVFILYRKKSDES